MSREVRGQLEYCDGTAIAGAEVRFDATRNGWIEGLLPSATLYPSATLIPSGDDYTPIYSSSSVITDDDGSIWARLNLGQYRVLLQESGSNAWLSIGAAKVVAGGAVALGELIEFTSSTLEATYADVATKTWVEATYSAGTPSSIAITGLSTGGLTATDFLAVSSSGIFITARSPRAQQLYYAYCAPHRKPRSC